jgi:hypothetical protein
MNRAIGTRWLVIPVGLTCLDSLALFTSEYGWSLQTIDGGTFPRLGIFWSKPSDVFSFYFLGIILSGFFLSPASSGLRHQPCNVWDHLKNESVFTLWNKNESVFTLWNKKVRDISYVLSVVFYVKWSNLLQHESWLHHPASLDSNLLGLRSLCWWVKMFPSRWSVETCRFLGFLILNSHSSVGAAAARLTVVWSLPWSLGEDSGSLTPLKWAGTPLISGSCGANFRTFGRSLRRWSL